jgi:hypothetical protein
VGFVKSGAWQTEKELSENTTKFSNPRRFFVSIMIPIPISTFHVVSNPVTQWNTATTPIATTKAVAESPNLMLSLRVLVFH